MSLWDNPADMQAYATLEAPGGYGTFGQQLTLQVDVTVRTSSMAPEVPQTGVHRPFTLAETAYLIDALAEVLTAPDLVSALAELAGVDAYAVPQPRNLHLVTARALTSVLDTAALAVVPDAGTSHGAHLLSDPAHDLANPAQRWAQVLRWLEQIPLDGGLTGAERLLEHLPTPSPSLGR